MKQAVKELTGWRAVALTALVAVAVIALIVVPATETMRGWFVAFAVSKLIALAAFLAFGRAWRAWRGKMPILRGLVETDEDGEGEL